MVLHMTRITDALPVVFPSHFVTLSYASSLLLDARFPASIVGDTAFSVACESGFDSYFSDMSVGSTLEKCFFVDRFYTWREVEKEVVENTVVAYERDGERLPWCAGFALGWLSALALVQPQEAMQGLSLLDVIVRRSSVQPVSDGFPLDM